MANPMQEAMVSLASALSAFTVTKIESTRLLTNYIMKYNAGASHAELSAILTEYVNKFNEVTALSNQLRTIAGGVQTLSDTMTVGFANLTDAQVEEMKTNPQQYFAAGYLALTNSLLFFNKADALTVIEAVHTDLITDLNNAWADYDAGVTPVIPRPAVVFDNGHALDLVSKALLDATVV